MRSWSWRSSTYRGESLEKYKQEQAHGDPWRQWRVNREARAATDTSNTSRTKQEIDQCSDRASSKHKGNDWTRKQRQCPALGTKKGDEFYKKLKHISTSQEIDNAIKKAILAADEGIDFWGIDDELLADATGGEMHAGDDDDGASAIKQKELERQSDIMLTELHRQLEQITSSILNTICLTATARETADDTFNLLRQLHHRLIQQLGGAEQDDIYRQYLALVTSVTRQQWCREDLDRRKEAFGWLQQLVELLDTKYHSLIDRLEARQDGIQLQEQICKMHELQRAFNIVANHDRMTHKRVHFADDYGCHPVFAGSSKDHLARRAQQQRLPERHCDDNKQRQDHGTKYKESGEPDFNVQQLENVENIDNADSGWSNAQSNWYVPGWDTAVCTRAVQQPENTQNVENADSGWSNAKSNWYVPGWDTAE